MCKKIKMLDCFAGIGGFHIGIEEACKELGIEFECVGAIEFNKHSRETYSANFPTTPLLGLDVNSDITKIDLATLPKHNLLVGGFPCQAFSRARHNRKESAGTHATEHDDRVDLFYYLCQILSIHKPKYFIFENVPDLLKETYPDGTKVIDNIIKEINKCGYNVWYKVLNTKDFGSPQVRERLIFVGSERLDFIENFYDKNCRCLQDILEDNVDSKYLLDNLWKNIKNHVLPGSRYDAILKAYNSDKWKKPTVPINKVVTSARVEGDTPSGNSRQRDRVFNSLGLSPTLISSTAISISIDKKKILRQLTPREYARIQCFPDTFKILVKDSYAYAQFGNAVCPNMIKGVFKAICQ